jgi:hypothetical protein
LFVQLPDRFRRCFLDRIRDAENSRHLAVNNDEHHCLTFAALLFSASAERITTSAEFFDQCAVAQRNRMTVDTSLHAFARQRLKRLRLYQRHTAFLGARNDRRRERMFAASFETRSQLQ